MYRIGIDTGGTFTDAVLWDDERGLVGTCKVPSDNANPANAVFNAACSICRSCGIDIHDVQDIVHGTTVATNLTLEANGPRIALLTTAGFRDVLEIGRLTRPSSALYDLLDAGMKPLVARRDRFEIDERIDSHGAEERPLCEEDVVKAVDVMRSRGITSVAVCYLFSFMNPAHEIATRAIIERLAPEMSVSLSCDILPQVREYERTAATVINAYLKPVCGPYLQSLQDVFESNGLHPTIWVMQSNGGMTTPQYASSNPINLLMSGPSGGVVAAKAIANRLGLDNVISVDMGGTSFDVSCVTNGTIPLSTAGEALGMPLRIPSVDISTIGTGGGSIAYADVAGQLHVGPRSAGARPGPASYGQGGTLPTVTDANVVLGYIPDGARLGDSIVVSREAAVRACEPLARQLGLGIVELALGIREISTAAMAGAVRRISVGKGKDPRNFALLAFGGAGPLQAVDIARAMGIGCVVVPQAAGVLSALGLVNSDVVRTFTRSIVGQPQVNETIADAVKGLQSQADELDASLPGFESSRSFFFSMRYAGQNSTLSVPIADPLSPDVLQDAAEGFNRLHDEVNGYCDPSMPTLIDGIDLVFAKRVAVRTVASAREGQGAFGDYLVPERTRTIWLDDSSTCEMPVFILEDAPHPSQVMTPCIISSSTTSIVVPEGTSCRIDDEGNVVIEIKE